MFIDRAELRVKAGDGGNGVVSFRHEKYVDKGGPDGGDGGDGGDIVFLADSNQDSLANFRYQKLIKAESGVSGGKQKKRGRSGQDTTVNVPLGTTVFDGDKVVADFVSEGQSEVVAIGGKGGFGNAHFKSSTRQAPRIAEKGEPGEEFTLSLELKTIADVGLVGLPNAGKSTFLASVSNAHPAIADYPFTTLNPHIGVVDIDSRCSLVVADIPGLIEGASEGKGLGDEFLRHVERTSVLLHLIDVYENDVAGSYKTIMRELRDYRIDLTQKPQIVALTKIEGLDEDILELQRSELRKVVPKATEIYAISSHSKQGVKPLMSEIKKLVEKEKQKATAEADEKSAELPVITISSENTWSIEQRDGEFVVRGAKIERFARRLDLDDEFGVERIKDIMRKMGIIRGLNKYNIKPKDKVWIGDEGIIEF